MAPATRTKDSAPSPDQQAPSLTLEISDFGPIAEGRVDLRPLTVFAGPSNTGKSWMATLIYAMRHLPRLRFEADESFAFLYSSTLELWYADTRSNFPEDINSWKKCLLEGKDIRFSHKELELLRRVKADTLVPVMYEMSRCYGFSHKKLIRQTSKGPAKIRIEARNSDNRIELYGGHKAPVFQSELLDVSLAPTSSLFLQIEKCIANNHQLKPTESNDVSIADIYHPVFDLMEKILKALQGACFFSNAFYLPADRGGIMRNQELLVRNLIRSAARNGDYLGDLIPGASQNGDNPDTGPSLTGIFADFLEQLPGLKETSPEMMKADFGELSQKLEKNILRGAVKVRKSATGYPILSYQPVDWKETLSFKNVSSMVAELAPVSLYLQQIVKPGDLLILEEPETNLHPEMQQEFIREVASWVDAGLKVVLTTHSDWVINELSNIVARNQLSEIAPKKKSKLPRLSQDKIGVYVFNHIDKNKPTKGSEIEEIEWESDKGGYDTGFYKVAMNQHNEWADTMNAVADQKVAEKEKSGSDK